MPVLEKSKNLKKITIFQSKKLERRFLGGSVVKNLPANGGDTGSIPDLGRSHMLSHGATKPMSPNY